MDPVSGETEKQSPTATPKPGSMPPRKVFTTTEEVYRTLVETFPHVVWVGNSDGNVTFLNQAWYEWTGRAVEESLGSRWAESVHPDDAEALLAKWKKAYSEGAPYEGECRFVATDGSFKNATFIGVPVRDHSGKITNWVGIDIDITKLKQAEEKLQEKIRELETINELMVDRELKMVELKEEIKRLKTQLQKHG